MEYLFIRNGVLTVIIPFAEESQKKKITVSANGNRIPLQNTEDDSEIVEKRFNKFWD